MKKVVIIGAGAAGLASAAYLAKAGFAVTVFEKNAFPGGRCASFSKDGHRFDIGATLLMMPDVYERMFADFGRKMREELSLVRMDPVYRLVFPGGKVFSFSSDLFAMQQQMESLEPGSYARFLTYMDRSFSAYKVSMKHIIDRNYDHVFQFFNPINLFRLARLDAFGKHHRVAARYFDNEMLRTAFTFQNIYVGQNPFNASAIFSMLPFMELTDGVFFPEGGMNTISQKLEEIAIGYGVEIRYRTAVERIVVDKVRGAGYEVRDAGYEVRGAGYNSQHATRNFVRGVHLQDGTFVPADIVLANADLPYVYNELLPPGMAVKRINRLGYTCSALVFHWGMDTVLPNLEQHNVFVSDNYRQNIESVFRKPGVAEEPSFYVHSAARGDASAAPAGQDSVSVIVPVGNLGIGGLEDLKIGGLEDLKIGGLGDLESGRLGDWEKVKEMMRASVLKRLAAEGVADVEKHIKFEKVYHPVIWKNMFNLSRGATFGSLNHNLLQMGWFRPHNRHPRYKNLFFAGGSTHPGNGVPLALISARLATEKVIEQFA